MNLKKTKQAIMGVLVVAVLSTLVLFSAPTTAIAQDLAGTTFNHAPPFNDGHYQGLVGHTLVACAGNYQHDTGSYHRDIANAKIKYQNSCNQTWRYDSGQHFCAWSPFGWRCGGPSGW